MSAFRPKLWTAAGLALLAGGLAGCGDKDVVKEEPTPVPPAATAPGEAGERGETVMPAEPGSGERADAYRDGFDDGDRGGEGADTSGRR